MKKLKLVLGLSNMGLFAAAFANGGMEGPVLPAGTYSFATVPTSWVKVDPQGGNVLQTYGAFGLSALGQEGQQAYGWGGSGTTGGSLAQTFDTIAGGTYLVSFQYVAQLNPNPGPQRLLAEALNGSTILNSSQIKFTNVAWITASFSFTAATTSTTLRFSDTQDVPVNGIALNEDWALDSVTVTQSSQGSGVPEPSTFALAAGALAFLAYRRR